MIPYYPAFAAAFIYLGCYLIHCAAARQRSAAFGAVLQLLLSAALLAALVMAQTKNFF